MYLRHENKVNENKVLYCKVLRCETIKNNKKVAFPYVKLTKLLSFSTRFPKKEPKIPFSPEMECFLSISRNPLTNNRSFPHSGQTLIGRYFEKGLVCFRLEGCGWVSASSDPPSLLSALLRFLGRKKCSLSRPLYSHPRNNHGLSLSSGKNHFWTWFCK